MKLLEGKTALITGCNRGIGHSVLKAFVANGASIIACTRTMNDELIQEYQQLSKQNGVHIYPITMDLSSSESIRQGMNDVIKLKVPIDILVNNAGVATIRSFLMTKIDAFKEIMQVNLYAPIMISQYVVKNMLKQNKGSIINFSSISGLDMNAGNAAYGASKAAVASLTKTMAKELAKVGIRVNAIAPGFVETDMNRQVTADYMDMMLHQIALKRIAKPEEIARTAVFLASDESSYITGQIIRIDGGM